jgi:NAD(P)-dependent dehydrogenase (short-subunit alcohol dehydrogenase family)
VSAETAALACVGDRPLLEDSVVVLSGATGGIGRSIALMLVAARARLAVTDIAAAAVDELASELDVFGAACDVSSWEGFASFLSTVEAELGPVDGVVNCAGLWAPAPYDQVDERAFAETLDANLKTSTFVTGTVLRVNGGSLL